jgi:CO/xanthine dehydrogenase Mo-binding subunit/aerobic-type carbon monoxide dehydrogenase small subunit (CoxS/CutS family)
MSGRTRVVVNGVERHVATEPDRSVLHVLREELDLTGAKYGCGEGACGSCTVLVDGRPMRSCTTLLADVRDRTITTVEGLAADGRLDPLVRAFLDEGAMQCGFCTPGMAVAATALLAATRDPSDEAIATALDGNVCRCGAYQRILRAIRRAAAGDVSTTDEVGPPTIDAPLEMARPRAPWGLTEAHRRDYFDVLPEGLVVVLDPGEDDGTSWSTTRDAWIHIGRDGTVTAFTGKVNVGQDNRTALRLVVAAELGAPLGAVRLVMGDTDVCPFDMGTFGSRSIPDAGRALRLVSAAARAVLIAAAAGRWAVDRGAVEVSKGAVREPASGRSVPVGDLVAGERRVEVVAATDVRLRDVPPQRAPVRHGTVETVTGARRYVSDLSRPGMLHGAILRGPWFGASLRTADATEAEAIPGVTIVRDGGIVGAVAADPVTAVRAIREIRAEWSFASPQPSDADLVEHLRAHPAEADGWGGAFRGEIGDADRALADAEVRVEATYTTAYLAHVPLETRVALAEWEGDRLTVWTGTQRPFAVRSEVAVALGVPETDVRVSVPDAGGGYGGKHSGEVGIEAARLARAVGAPVKVRWSREEEFTWAYFRPAAVIDVAAGARDGALTAWSFTNINAGGAGIESPYATPDQRIVFQPAESPLRQGSYRALAATANHFARESHVDELAYRVGADPVEFRLRHLSDERLADVVRAAAAAAGWPCGAPSLGIACGVEKDAYVATCVRVRVEDDGRMRVERIVTAVDCGAIIDRDGLINQVEGVTVMGLGGALTEAIHFAEGRIVDPCLSRYPVPRFMDVPPIEVILIDRPDEPPAGAGETPIGAVAPAIANAIFAASGVRLRSLPLLPGGRIER